MNSNQITAQIAVTAYKNSNPVVRKSFSLRRKTIIKHEQMRKRNLATGFVFVYAVTALYFINFSLSCPRKYLNDLAWHNQHIIYLPQGSTEDFEYIKNSSLLKPKTEFSFNSTQFFFF